VSAGRLPPPLPTHTPFLRAPLPGAGVFLLLFLFQLLGKREGSRRVLQITTQISNARRPLCRSRRQSVCFICSSINMYSSMRKAILCIAVFVNWYVLRVHAHAFFFLTSTCTHMSICIVHTPSLLSHLLANTNAAKPQLRRLQTGWEDTFPR